MNAVRADLDSHHHRPAHIGTGEDWAQLSNPAQDGPEQPWRNSHLGHLKPDIPCLDHDLGLNLFSDQCLTLWVSASQPRKFPQLYAKTNSYGMGKLRPATSVWPH